MQHQRQRPRRTTRRWQRSDPLSPTSCCGRSNEEIASLAQREAEIATALAALAMAASGEVENAKKGVESARQQAQEAQEAHICATSALDTARAQVNAQIGELKALRTQLEVLDRDRAAALVERWSQALAALPAPPSASDVDVEKTEREV